MTPKVEEFTLYERGTGRIISSGTSCLPQKLAGPTCDVIIGVVGRVGEQYVQAGVLANMPPRPSSLHEFDYSTKSWRLNESTAWATVKSRRAELLGQTDWMVTRAAERGESLEPAWLAYRQALRDITKQADPTNIVWPKAPG